MSDDDQDDDLLCGCGEDECPECNHDCHYCGGEGCGFYGSDFPNPDPLWYDENEVVDCPNCHGSGKAKDCTFW